MNRGNRRSDRESETTSDREGGADSATEGFSTPSVDEASGFGVTMTIVVGVLLALGYYGTLAVTEAGFGQAVPPPFYLLALALVFVLELSRRRSFDARGLTRAVGITASFGMLVILALEGGAYLWENPEVALDEWAGIAVLAVSLVVVAFGYVVYLSAVDSA